MIGGKKEESSVSVTFCKLQTHGLDDFTGLPRKRAKRCSARLREGELTQPCALMVAIEVWSAEEKK